MAMCPLHARIRGCPFPEAVPLTLAMSLMAATDVQTAPWPARYRDIGPGRMAIAVRNVPPPAERPC
jgi:hypothetical protein